MEIQKIFSDNQDNERLYTILMNDDELRLYGEFQKEFNSRAAKERNRKFFKSISEHEYENFGKKFKEMSDETAKDYVDIMDRFHAKNDKDALEAVKTREGRFNNRYFLNNRPEYGYEAKRPGIVSHNKMVMRYDKEVRNKLPKNNLLNKGLNFAKNHKVGVGVAGAGLATAGALATAKYLKNKQKDKEE